MSQLARAKVKISALGTYVPPRLLTNADLEKMVETSDEWIFQRTGMRERRLAGPGDCVGQAASRERLSSAIKDD